MNFFALEKWRRSWVDFFAASVVVHHRVTQRCVALFSYLNGADS